MQIPKEYEELQLAGEALDEIYDVCFNQLRDDTRNAFEEELAKKWSTGMAEDGGSYIYEQEVINQAKTLVDDIQGFIKISGFKNEVSKENQDSLMKQLNKVKGMIHKISK